MCCVCDRVQLISFIGDLESNLPLGNGWLRLNVNMDARQSRLIFEQVTAVTTMIASRNDRLGAESTPNGAIGECLCALCIQFRMHDTHWIKVINQIWYCKWSALWLIVCQPMCQALYSEWHFNNGENDMNAFFLHSNVFFSSFFFNIYFLLSAGRSFTLNSQMTNDRNNFRTREASDAAGQFSKDGNEVRDR